MVHYKAVFGKKILSLNHLINYFLIILAINLKYLFVDKTKRNSD